MENKRILVGLIIVLVSFGLCGCGITNSTAKKAAKEYIEDKYGQDAEVVKVSKNYKFTGPGGGLLPELSFSSFLETNNTQYVLNWYTISNGSVTHHEN